MTRGEQIALALTRCAARCLGSAETLDPCPEVASSRSIVVAMVRLEALRAIRDDPEQPGLFLRGLAATLRVYPVPDGSGSVQLRRGLDDLVQIIEAPWCNSCAELSGRCVGMAWECPAGLGGLLLELEDWAARQLHAALPGLRYPPIMFAVELVPATGPNTILGSHAVRGRTDADRSADTTFVTVEFVQEAFDADTMNQIPYVVFHELFCHVFQGVALGAVAGRRGRSNAPPSCLWTEAWMDSVALGLTREWWLETRKEAMPDAIRQYHDWGYGIGNRRRQLVRNAANHLSALWHVAGEPDRLSQDAVRFALRLNSYRGRPNDLERLTALLRDAMLDNEPLQGDCLHLIRGFSRGEIPEPEALEQQLANLLA